MKHSIMRASGAVVLALALLACGKEKNVDPPMELVDFKATLTVDRVWSAGTRGGDDVLRLGLAPSVSGERVYAAGHGGDVQALDLATGRGLWRTDTDAPLGAGPTSGEGLVAVGTVAGEVLALDLATGALRWRVAVGGEVLAAPAIAGGLVIVRTVAGRIQGLAVDDGREVWNFEQPVPRLTLRGTAPPVVMEDMVLVGLDNGKVVALSLSNGDLLWTSTVSTPSGRTEIERMVDLDSRLHVRGRDIYVAGFQGRVAMLALESGQVWWGRDMSSHRGLVVDDDKLYITLTDSSVVALSRRDGTELWRQEQFLRRSLSAPALVGDALVVGDFQGYLHWLDLGNGAVRARTKTGSTIRQAPVVAGDLLIVQSEGGDVSAYRARAPR